jgi:hypothetical protein
VLAAIELASARSDHELAARLHGRLRHSEQVLRASIPPHFAAALETAVTEVSVALGADAFATHAAEGATLPWRSILRDVDVYLGGLGVAQAGALGPPDNIQNKVLRRD